MPAIRSFDLEKLTDLLIKNGEDLYDKVLNKIRPPKHQCWSNIAALMNMDQKYVYVIVNENRYGLRDKLNFVCETKDELSQDEDSDSDNSDDNLSITLNLNETSCKYMEFELELSSNDWAPLLISSEYRRMDDRPQTSRTYYVLKAKEWCNVMYDQFFQVTKLPCCIAFKRNKVHPNGTVYMKFEGCCNTCGSKLTGVGDKPIPEYPWIIRCTYVGDFQNCNTNAKRNIVGKDYTRFVDHLLNQNKSAAFVRREEASKKMEYGDPEPANLPSTNALRCLKYRKRLNSFPDSDCFQSVCQLKSVQPYFSAIHAIGADPFYLYYWTTSEINSYRSYCNNSRTPTISVDATGSLVRQLQLPSFRKTNHVFLYEITIYDTELKVTFSAGHMLSEKHDNNFIGSWLGEWKRADIPSPKIVVIDHSLALIMACVREFTQYSTLSQYLQVCSSLLKNSGHSRYDVPTCFIRSDFNHMMHNISTWEGLKGKDKRMKKLYLPALGLVIASTNYDDVKSLFENIFTVALHQFDGLNSDGNPTACERAKRSLKNRIALHDNVAEGLVEVDNKGVEDEFQSNYLDEISHQNLCEFSYFDDLQKIFKECEATSLYTANEGSHDNLQYNRELAKQILKFGYYLPLWSAVMTSVFKYGDTTQSSAASESRFNDLKNRVLKHKAPPIRVDDFLMTHITSIVGETNIIGSKYKTQSLSTHGTLQKDESIAVNMNQSSCGDEKNRSTMISGINIENSPTLDCSIAPVDEKFNCIPPTNHVITDEEAISANYAKENWRNLAVEKKKKKLSGNNYLSADRSILYMNEEKKTYHKVVSVLKNGGRCRLRSIKCNEKSSCRYSFSNTCAFDTIFQLLCVAYVESEYYCNFIDSQDGVLFQMVRDAINKKVGPEIYRKRGTILLSLCNEDQPTVGKRVVSINCATTAYNILSHLLLKEFPSLFQKVTCNECSFESERKRNAVMVNFGQEKCFEDLISMAAVIGTLSCKCGKGNFQNVYGQHLWIESCQGVGNIQVKITIIIIITITHNYNNNYKDM